MKNIKVFAIAGDGNMKRLAITYDVIDDAGKAVNPNKKINRLITDDEVLNAISVIERYSQEIIDSEE